MSFDINGNSDCGCGTTTGQTGVFGSQDCTGDRTGCGNPCGTSPANTAACETLPSQIENFTKQFFGTVTKTEVNGVVVWSLPCSLDVGLQNNPRGVSEGLACYFLRLFQQGILGATGPQGPAGTPGTNGSNAFTVTLHGFTQPTQSNPNVQVSTSFNPVIVPGLYVFITSSGWYQVSSVDQTGTLFLVLAKALPSASGTISAGKLVVPAGFPGVSIAGPQGIQGPAGPVGPSGSAFTATNGSYFATIGTDYPVQIIYADVNFVNSSPQILLPTKGVYLVTVAADIVGTGAIALSDIISLKLHNDSINADVPGTEHSLSNLVAAERGIVSFTMGVTTDGDNKVIALQAKATSANVFSVVALHTTIAFVRVS